MERKEMTKRRRAAGVSKGKSSIKDRFSYQYEVENDTGCWLWIGTISSHSGYGRIAYKGNSRNAHRVSWEIHNGKIPKGMLVCHKCDVRSCVNPDHLFVGTPKDNIQDCIKKGRFPRHESHQNAKLTEQDCEYIRSSDEDPRDIAKRLGVHMSTVYRVRCGITWRPFS